MGSRACHGACWAHARSSCLRRGPSLPPRDTVDARDALDGSRSGHGCTAMSPLAPQPVSWPQDCRAAEQAGWCAAGHGDQPGVQLPQRPAVHRLAAAQPQHLRHHLPPSPPLQQPRPQQLWGPAPAHPGPPVRPCLSSPGPAWQGCGAGSPACCRACPDGADDCLEGFRVLCLLEGCQGARACAPSAAFCHQGLCPPAPDASGSFLPSHLPGICREHQASWVCSGCQPAWSAHGDESTPGSGPAGRRDHMSNIRDEGRGIACACTMS